MYVSKPRRKGIVVITHCVTLHEYPKIETGVEYTYIDNCFVKRDDDDDENSQKKYIPSSHNSFR